MLSSNTSAVSGDTVYVEDVFSTYVYGTSASPLTITNNIDLSTKGGLVWTKGRNLAEGHRLVDTVRGATKALLSNSTSAETVETLGLTSFLSNGYVLNADSGYNGTVGNSYTYAGWTFRKQPKFFDVVTYTGNGTQGRQIAHSLGVPPACIMVKCTSTTSDWAVYHDGIGASQYLNLNLTNAAASSAAYWDDASPTAAVFTVGNGAQVNTNGATYVAYIFSGASGGFGLTGTDNVISCGSFTSNGSGYATISLGYEPQWVMVKKSSGIGNWYLIDTMRGFVNPGNPDGSDDARLYANTSGAENPIAQIGYPTSTGFFFNEGETGTYIYIAIRRGPMKVPTDATKVFNPSVRASGTGAAYNLTGVGFPPDLLVSSERTTGVLFTKGWHDRLRGNVILRSENTNNEAADSTGVTAYGQDGFSFGTDGGFASVNYSGSNYVYEAFRRAPSFFDEVCYTGTGSATTFNHNLGVVPELMIVKRRDTARGWVVYSAALGATKSLQLQLTDAEITVSTIWNNTAPTSNVFTVGTNLNSNTSGGTYVNYLFATCAGVSKVGSYTGTGTTKQVDCGFAAGARFVLIKRTDSTGDWYTWDTVRGIVSGNDPYLLLNSAAAEVTTTDYIDTYSAGFELSSTAPAALNASGGTYIFLAIA